MSWYETWDRNWPAIMGCITGALMIGFFIFTIFLARQDDFNYDQVTWELIDSCDSGSQAACILLQGRRNPGHPRD